MPPGSMAVQSQIDRIEARQALLREVQVVTSGGKQRTNKERMTESIEAETEGKGSAQPTQERKDELKYSKVALLEAHLGTRRTQ